MNSSTVYYNKYLKGKYLELIETLEKSSDPHDRLLLAKCYLYTDQPKAAYKLLLSITHVLEEANILLQLIEYLEFSKEVTHSELAKAIQWIESPKPESQTYRHSFILALGSPADEQGHPKTRLQHTLVKTKEIWDTLQLPVLVTGGAVQNTFAEAQVMQKWLKDHGVTGPIFTETEALNTVQNFQNSRLLIKDHAMDHLHIVTADFHVNRAKCIAHQVLPEVAFTFYAANNPEENTPERARIEWFATYRDITRIMGLWR